MSRRARKWPAQHRVAVTGWVAFIAVSASPAFAQPAADVEVVLRGGVVRYVGPASATPKRTALSTKPSLSQSSSTALKTYAGYFGIANPATQLEHYQVENYQLENYKSSPLTTGADVLRYRQLQDGVPVLGAELVMTLDSNGQLRSLSGETKPALALETAAPRISSAQAIQTAALAVAKYQALPLTSLVASEPELAIYDASLIGPADSSPPRLVWNIAITTAAAMPVRERVLVDALDGGIALSFNEAETARNRLTYTANNGSALPGALVCNELQPLCSQGVNADADLAHRYAGDMYDFYQAHHGRDSYDDAGAALIATVEYAPPGFCPNAGFNGMQVLYCPGAAAADDIVGHELTHAMTRATSGLLYYYQSGAINESLSDVWGELLDLTNGSGTDTEAVRWKMGEDFAGTTPARDMRDPTLRSHPDRMSSPYYWTGAADNGGVHLNSGVNNKAVSLMVDGGNFNGYEVRGIGIDKVIAIYYRVQTQHLTSGSDYADLHLAVNRACQNLIGEQGITAADCVQVANAVDAVEMRIPPPVDANAEAPLCPTGQVNNDVYHDGFELGADPSRWSTSALSGAGTWSVLAAYAAAGKLAYATSGPSTQSDYALHLVQPVAVPANAHLHFRHSFDQEWSGSSGVPVYFDGGVLEYSVDHGMTWQDAGILYSAGKAYSGTLQGTNPLAGRSAFVGASRGYVSTRYNLGTLAGSAVRIRFRNTTDNDLPSGRAWMIDDVRLYTCVADSSPNAIPIANAGADRSAAPFQHIVLDGSASLDSDGFVVSSQWTQLSGTRVVTTASGRTLSFSAPVTPTQETLVFRLTVTDGRGASASDDVSVNVVNQQPAANAGSNEAYKPRMFVQLAGNATDSDGIIMSYAWSQIAGPPVTLMNPMANNASFIAPSVPSSATLTFRLTARDNFGGDGSDDVDLIIANSAPVANAGADTTAAAGAAVTLTGSGSDPDGAVAAYSWTQVSGPAASITNSASAVASVTMPGSGAITLRLTVSDNDNGTATDDVTLTVRSASSSGGGGGQFDLFALIALLGSAHLRRAVWRQAR